MALECPGVGSCFGGYRFRRDRVGLGTGVAFGCFCGLQQDQYCQHSCWSPLLTVHLPGQYRVCMLVTNVMRCGRLGRACGSGKQQGTGAGEGYPVHTTCSCLSGLRTSVARAGMWSVVVVCTVCVLVMVFAAAALSQGKPH